MLARIFKRIIVVEIKPAIKFAGLGCRPQETGGCGCACGCDRSGNGHHAVFIVPLRAIVIAAGGILSGHLIGLAVCFRIASRAQKKRPRWTARSPAASGNGAADIRIAKIEFAGVGRIS